MRSLTFTDFSAVTTVFALLPVFAPTLTFVTPLTLLSAACTFFEQPPAHLSPETSSVTVCSSAATTSRVVVAPITVGAARAPPVRTAKAASMVVVVFFIIINDGVS